MMKRILFGICLASFVPTADAAALGETRLTDGWEFAQVWKDTQPASTNKVVRRDLPADSPELVWQKVRVPHDWAIAGPFDPACPDGGTGRLPWVGVGWYRRTLTLPAEAKGAFVALRFDGVMARPEVFLNGEKVGGWDYGYLGFEVDISGKVRFGEKNELLVKADTSGHKSRWYPGAGIYRDVTLVVEDKENRLIWNTLKITTPEVTAKRAKVRVEYETPKGAAREEFVIEKPILWSPDNPHLYEHRIFGKTYRYGVRTFAWTADDGFHLNGKRLQLKGVNLHSDLGPLGMAFNRDAMRRQLAIMKEMGVNAFRASHNPPDPQALDLCDEMGFVVWDECFDKWDGTAGILDGEDQEEYVTRNLRAFVRRDRNHPSIVCWSIGNEVPHATADYPSGSTAARCAAYRAAVLAEDATRPVGIGTNWKNCIETGDYESLDLTGWNYTGKYAFMKAKYPDKPVVYSESASAFSTYGFYRIPLAPGPRDFKPDVLELDSYDRIVAGDTPDAEFARMATDRYCAGDFVWTGIDYLGEPTPNAVGNRSSFFGICDLMGLPKDRYYLYRSVWNEKAHTVHLLPHWNWDGREGAKIPVVCYTDGDEAELFLNGKSLGRRAKRKDLPPVVAKTEPSYYDVNACYRLMWEVPYAPGELKVIAFKGGRKIGEAVRRTAGAAVAVKLTPDRTALKPDGLAFVTVELTDDKGVLVPLRRDRVSFALEGPGELVAVGNGSANEMDSFADTASHRLDNGRALVVVRRTGGMVPLKLTASAAGLRSATATFVPAQTVRVDDQLPAGNIVFERIEGDRVFVHQDLRDTKGAWFYWAMRVTGAAGRTLTFNFTRSAAVGARGPVVSRDGGKTFSYAASKGATRKSFVYTFAPDENETLFYECYPYVLADWRAFVARQAGRAGFRTGVLCRSRKGADVPLAEVGCLDRPPRFRVCLTARHHCSETTASWVLEGVVDQALADDELGAWLRENVAFTVVPFVDFDGAQAGDQGKNRKPHDHNRDYTEFLYPETKALAARLSREKPDVFLDVHCPWLHGGLNEKVYTPWSNPVNIRDIASERKFSELLEKLQGGELRYRAADDLPYGVDWNKDANFTQGLSSTGWAQKNVPSLRIVRTLEIPFANANGAVVTPDACRAFGRDIAKALRALFESSPVRRAMSRGGTFSIAKQTRHGLL